MLINEIIRAAIPDASEAMCEYILWERTPFPVGKITAKSLYRAAARTRRCSERGIKLCDFCDNIAVEGRWACVRCNEVLHQPMPEAETKKAPPGIPNEA